MLFPRWNRWATIMYFILTYLLMLFQQVMLYSTGSSRDGCDENDCMVTHSLRCALKANWAILRTPPLPRVFGSYTELYIPLSIIVSIIIIIIIIIISSVKERSRSNCGHTPSNQLGWRWPGCCNTKDGSESNIQADDVGQKGLHKNKIVIIAVKYIRIWKEMTAVGFTVFSRTHLTGLL